MVAPLVWGPFVSSELRRTPPPPNAPSRLTSRASTRTTTWPTFVRSSVAYDWAEFRVPRVSLKYANEPTAVATFPSFAEPSFQLGALLRATEPALCLTYGYTIHPLSRFKLLPVPPPPPLLARHIRSHRFTRLAPEWNGHLTCWCSPVALVAAAALQNDDQPRARRNKHTETPASTSRASRRTINKREIQS